MTNRIRVLIADDHVMVRAGLAQILQAEGGIDIVGEAATGEEAVFLAQQNQPDIVLMDVRMAGMGGIEATRSITRTGSAGAVIALSTFSDPTQVKAMRDAGARGYVSKEALAPEILSAIQSVHQGAFQFPVMEDSGETAVLDSVSLNIGDQQQRVLALMAKGLTNPEIAGLLDISRATVSYHVSAILRKLDVSNRAEAVALAIRENLISDTDF